MNFKDAYKLPLKHDHGIVWTQDNDRAFDFPNQWSYPNGLKLDKDSRDNVIAIINGDERMIGTDLKLSYVPNESMIYTEATGERKQFISIRGWGNLTGVGGLNLDEDIAAKIQDDFAEYIIKRLESSYK